MNHRKPDNRLQRTALRAAVEPERQAAEDALVPKGSVSIRLAEPPDCAGILEAHVGAIRELCNAEYSETQLAAWAERPTPGGYLPAIARNTFLVAENEGRVVAFAEFAPSRGEVVAMYVHPKHARSGKLLEGTGKHRGRRLTVARSSWPAARRDR